MLIKNSTINSSLRRDRRNRTCRTDAYDFRNTANTFIKIRYMKNASSVCPAPIERPLSLIRSHDQTLATISTASGVRSLTAVSGPRTFAP